MVMCSRLSAMPVKKCEMVVTELPGMVVSSSKWGRPGRFVMMRTASSGLVVCMSVVLATASTLTSRRKVPDSKKYDNTWYRVAS